MSRFSLKKSERSRAESVTPEVLPPSARGGGGFSLPQKAIPGMLKLATDMVAAKRDIATIEANSEAEIRKMEKEIERATVEANNYIAKLEAENKGWHSRFEKTKAFAEKIIEELGKHPEWSDVMREQVKELAKGAMEV